MIRLHERARRPLALAVVLLLALPLLVGLPRAEAAQPTDAPPNSGPVNLQTGYPFWYTDRAGLQLDLCLDAGVDAGGLCIAGLPNPAAPASVPDNYPAGDGEAFYWAGDAAMDLPAISDRADTRLVLAMEAAFMNDAVAPWEQMTFGRVRIDADDLVPNETYTFVHPYGTETLTTDDRGRIRYTEDIGGFNPPSDFTEALNSRPALGFLRWDPAVEPAPPDGHIGTLTPHTVVGSPFNTNYFEIQGPGLGEAGASGTQRTDDFEIQGRLWAPPAGPRLGLDHPTNVVDFDRQLAAGAPVTRNVVLTNVGAAPLTITDVTLEDTPAAVEPFTVGAHNCATLATDATCTVPVTFDGAAAGLANGDVVGNLVVASDDVAFATQNVRLTAAFGPQPQIQGPIDPDTGFPLWYEDSNGVRLDLCQDQGTANGGVCLAELRNPLAPPKVPENWAIARNTAGQIIDEPESFWWSADADLEAQIPGSTRALLVLGLEATFGGDESVVMGMQNAFGRVRIRFRGLQANAEFEVTHPYGVETLGTDGEGEINVTRDVGCFVSPCDYSLPLTAQTWPFLTAVNPAPPAGTVGNPEVGQTVTGSPIDQNIFRIAGPGIPGGAVQTDQFVVQGRRWVPPAQPTVAIDGRFGEVAFGNQTENNAEQTITLTNAGAQALNVSGLRMVGRDAADFTLGATSCPGLAAGTDIDPAGTCEVPVTFSAQSRGVKEAAIEVTSNDPMSPQLIRVSGNALFDPPPPPPDGPVLTVSPRSLTFAEQTVGTTSDPRTVTLTNTGGAPLSIASITASGDFAETNDCAEGEIAPAGTCTISVTFTPSAAGQRAGSLQIGHTAPSSPRSVGLTGTGVAAPPEGPVLQVAPTSLPFAGQTVGTTSVAQTVTLTNSGGAPLSIASITASGDFAETNDCAEGEIAPAGTCTISVTFSPTATGLLSGNLVIAHNADGSPTTVALSGTGVAPALAGITAAKDPLSFGTVRIGRTKSSNLKITNTGTAPLTVAHATTGDTQFTATPGNCQNVAPRRSCNLSVTFAPTGDPGPRNAILEITSNALPNPFPVRLEGQAR